MTWQKFVALFNTDSLALFAIGGLVAVFVVTIGVFGFLMTRRDPRQVARK